MAFASISPRRAPGRSSSFVMASLKAGTRGDHSLTALAEAGYRGIAPDMRGFGQTDRPEEIEKYTLFHLVGDMIGILDGLEVDKAVIVGHDWGAPVAWHSALLRPDRFRAVVG